jgi:hypothetical protein
MGVRNGSMVVSVALFICLVLLGKQVEKSGASKLPSYFGALRPVSSRVISAHLSQIHF